VTGSESLVPSAQLGRRWIKQTLGMPRRAPCTIPLLYDVFLALVFAFLTFGGGSFAFILCSAPLRINSPAYGTALAGILSKSRHGSVTHCYAAFCLAFAAEYSHLYLIAAPLCLMRWSGG
jgi:hypothetical protein